MDEKEYSISSITCTERASGYDVVTSDPQMREYVAPKNSIVFDELEQQRRVASMYLGQ